MSELSKLHKNKNKTNISHYRRYLPKLHENNRFFDLVGRVFAKGLGDLGFKMVLDTSLLNTQ